MQRLIKHRMKTNHNPDKTSVLVVAILGGFLPPFMMSSTNVALPQMGRELAMDAISLGWIVTAFVLGSVIFLVPFGRIADMYGRKKIYTVGMIVFAVASLLLAGANSGIMLIALRFLQGIGGSFIFSTGIAIVTSVFSSNERGRVLGLFAAAVYLGQSAGPFLGGLLTQYFGWRSIFLVCVLISLLVIALIFWRLKGDWAEAERERFDIVGSVIYSLMLVALTYGFINLPTLFGLVLILIGIVGFAVFVIWEMRAVSPVLDIKIFRENRTFVLSCLAAFISYGATYAVGFLLSLYLQYIKGFGPQDAGFVLVSQPVVQTLFSPLAGRISDRIQPRIVASAGMAFTVVALLLLVFLNQETAMPLIIISLVLLGFGVALFVSPNTNAMMSSVEKRYYGVASAVAATMRQLGIIGSIGIVMLLFALYMGNVQIIPEYHGAFLQSVHTTFIIFAIFCFVGIFASLARGKRQEFNQEET